MKIRIIVFLLSFLTCGVTFSQDKKEPYVILISLDGFRYDYVTRFQPENLSRFIAGGTAATSLIPSFPTKTFPNHYTIATGLKPEHHGIVDNSFYNPKRDTDYKINKREVITDGTWYGGTPLWVLAEQNGMKAASFFYVGSEADVQGVRPSYYFEYDGRIKNLTRVSQVFDWLQLPEEERPHMITMYFSDMDDVGHRFGPNQDEELSKRLTQLDRELGALFEGVKSLDLDVNIFIVSDHGMANVGIEKYVPLDLITEGVSGRIVNSGALGHIYLDDPKDKMKAIAQMKGKAVGYKVIDPLEGEYYQDVSLYGERIGDIIILADLDYYLIDKEADREVIARRMRIDNAAVRGTHGYSQEYAEMHGIFYANGPQIRSGLKIESFENIHIYPLICKILGLPAPEFLDGKLEVLEPILNQ
ncbi:alkaline phosphatase family protein [Algoriphagus pacificus]|uniref:Alkaline phosphatase family protein n=1 Tax=Algoriphagus pacificus TaxID=2811234 RepID=A0ABS3CEM4_9BACT|nr:ectonucleotide pyrophosphatase/phosphodiesterase [Algoriphagus pacificus]MBN7815557.1 alkaline phosphatase family protein [Algoriphagus pacificus]